MKKLNYKFLFQIKIKLLDTYKIGETPYGERRVDIFEGGTFEGPRLKGILLPGGSDTLLKRNNGSFQPNVRVTLKTDDNVLILMTYRGIRHSSPEVAERIFSGEEVKPTEYYLRSAPFFETASEKYGWLNNIVSVGVGERLPNMAVYDVYEIL